MNGSAYRSETGAAVVSWPNTPDPVDPDAFEVSLDPNLMVLAARGEARKRSRFGLWFAGFVVAFLVMCLVAGVTLAQQPAPPCPSGHPPQPRAEIVKLLADRYEESLTAVGVLTSGFLVEIYVSQAKGTWTAVTTSPAGMSCVTAAGRNWESLPATPAGSLASYGDLW